MNFKKYPFHFLLFGLVISASHLRAQDVYLGEVRLFAGNFAPKGWALCEGQLLPIASNTALFSLLGTTYGGDGKTTFALPDLRGRVVAHVSNFGAGIANLEQGEVIGSATYTLTVNNMPSHTHQVKVNVSAGNSEDPTNSFPANTGATDKDYTPRSATGVMHSAAVGLTGGGQPVNNMQPTIVINYIIALDGAFPQRP